MTQRLHLFGLDFEPTNEQLTEMLDGTVESVKTKALAADDYTTDRLHVLDSLAPKRKRPHGCIVPGQRLPRAVAGNEDV